MCWSTTGTGSAALAAPRHVRRAGWKDERSRAYDRERTARRLLAGPVQDLNEERGFLRIVRERREQWPPRCQLGVQFGRLAGVAGETFSGARWVGD